MSYVTTEDLEKEFSVSDLARLTGDQSGLSVSDDRIQNASDNASALIDAKLSGRYELPFSFRTPPLIKKIATDLTIAFLYESTYAKTGVPESIVRRKSDAVSCLKQLQSGELSLPGFKASESAPPAIIANRNDSSESFEGKVLDAYFSL